MNILLIQWRKDRVMADHEFDCFIKYSGRDRSSVKRLDACTVIPTLDILEGVDALVVGGSGDYLVSQNDIPRQTAGMFLVLEEARHRSIPTLGICFGSQIMTKAFGGLVVKDESREEAGTFIVQKSEGAEKCPVLQYLPDTFSAQLGHKDHLEYLPVGAVNLVSSEKSTNQYWVFPGEPIHAVLWHPELKQEDLQYRLRFYAKVYGWSEDKIQLMFETLKPSPHASDVLHGFFEEVVKKGRVYSK